MKNFIGLLPFKFAAVGDSFTAGIGAGKIYSTGKSDVSCSRYDMSYPAVMNRFMAGADFSYLACSGDTSTDISSQIDNLDSDQDLVVLTAGGNDLCLSAIIASCIVSPVSSESSCQKTIDHASDGIDDYLSDNIKSLLEKLDDKMADNGIVVFVLYAEYFDVTSDACATEQNWAFPLGNALSLTTERRETFNDLVQKTNAALKKGAKAASTSKMTLTIADWDPWVKLRKGHMCMPGASPDPNDSTNDGLMFFKLNTRSMKGNIVHDELRRRGDGAGGLDWLTAAQNITELEMEEADHRKIWEAAIELQKLADRDITAASCDSSLIQKLIGVILGDGVGKIFHPNELGHTAIASYALDAALQARAQLLGEDIGDSCVASTTLTCSQKSGSKKYASDYSLYSNTADFCSSVKSNAPSNGRTNWEYEKTYYSGTLDESTFKLQLANGASEFDEDSCNTAVNSILDDCDGNDASNPMNFKFGGTLVDGSYTYTISPQRSNRPWPVPTEPTGSCKGKYKFLWDSYDIYGTGWASWDSGQKSLRPNSTNCFGLGLTKWKFEYYDEPDSNGMEWHASFRSPIWTRSRCFNNNKVQSGAGGPSSGGCSGNG
ncbi:SGNH hydrolase [Penicillium herquei]|nr:SGNH hydrolase [Penicillium herquei]